MFGALFLMLPGKSMHGLVSFFVAHLLYIGAFVVGGADGSNLSIPGVVALAAVGTIGAMVFGRLRSDVLKAGGRAVLTGVTLYIVIISVMVWMALASGRFFAIAGAVLFYLSDALRAWNRFVRPFHGAG